MCANDSTYRLGATICYEFEFSLIFRQKHCQKGMEIPCPLCSFALEQEGNWICNQVQLLLEFLIIFLFDPYVAYLKHNCFESRRGNDREWGSPDEGVEAEENSAVLEFCWGSWTDHDALWKPGDQGGSRDGWKYDELQFTLVEHLRGLFTLLLPERHQGHFLHCQGQFLLQQN